MQTTPPLKILLALEHSPHFVSVVNMLTHIKWPAGTLVHVLAVAPDQLPLMDTTPELRQGVNEAVEIDRWRSWATTKILTTQVAAQLQAHHLKIENSEICAGNLVEVALERAAASQPDLVVIGAKMFNATGAAGPNPTAHKLANDAQQSFLVVRPSKQVCPLHTILAVDGSPEAWQALEFVRSLSLPNWARVTLICLDSNPPEADSSQLALLDATEAFASNVISYMHNCGVSVRWLRRGEHSANELLAVAKEQEADLIVVGAKQRAAVLPLPRPSLTQNIIKYAPCSVLVVRQENTVAV